MWSELLAIIFPDRCISCGREGSLLCAICERTITSRPIALSGTVAALYDYKNPLIKKAIWALKYQHKRALGKYFGIALYREFFKQLARSKKENGDIYLIPIPAGKKARTLRGYNHATVIANAIAEAAAKDGLKLIVRDDILIKRHETTQQVKVKEKRKREQNVEDIFVAENAEELRGKTVILVDDVITTGSTVLDAKRAVKVWGPKRLLVIAVAH